MKPAWERVAALEPDECLRLLSSVRVGRVGWCAPAGPQVLPVNHTVLDGSIVFRTDLYTVLAAATHDSTVAFEADELDDRMQSGWSVLVLGTAEHVDDPAEMAELFNRMREPWAAGDRPLVARIVPLQLTGRHFQRDR